MAVKRTGEALYEFLKESGYLARLASVASSKDERKVANIARFFEIVRGFSVVAESDTIQVPVSFNVVSTADPQHGEPMVVTSTGTQVKVTPFASYPAKASRTIAGWSRPEEGVTR